MHRLILSAIAVLALCQIGNGQTDDAFQLLNYQSINDTNETESSMYFILVGKSSTTLQLGILFTHQPMYTSTTKPNVYNIQYYPMGSSGSVIKVTLTAAIHQGGPGSFHVVNITNLVPDTLYMVQVSAKDSMESAPGIFLTRAASSNLPFSPYDEELMVPVGTKAQFKCYHQYKDDPNVEWEIHDYSRGRYFGGRTTHKGWSYQIDQVEKEDALKEVVCTKDYAGGITHRYTIRFGILIPPSAPGEFNCKASGEHGLLFYWIHAGNSNISRMKETLIRENDIPRHFQSEIDIAIVDPVRYYKLRYRKLNCDDEWKEKNITGTCLSAEIQGTLTPRSASGAQLIAVNEAGEAEAAVCTCFSQ